MICVVSLLWLTMAAGASQPSAPAERLAGRLQEKIDSLQSLGGRFVQSLESAALGPTRTERGRFAIRKPAMMRWEYETPEKKLAITDGRTTWLYLPEEREVHVGRLSDQTGGGAATLLLAGKLRLQLDFRARLLEGSDLVEAGPQGVAGAAVLELKPYRTSDEFDRILLAVEPDRLLIRRVTLVDPLGDRMVFELYDLVENPVLPDDQFHFEIPKGVDVISSR